MLTELRRLEMELVLRDETITRLRFELEMLRAGQTEAARTLFDASLEDLLQSAASPAAQLLTQSYLLETAGREVKARDVLVVARRVITALESAGLCFTSRPGEHAVYNPDQHQPLDAAQSLQPGDPVVVRVPGVCYGEKILTCALVEIRRTSS